MLCAANACSRRSKNAFAARWFRNESYHASLHRSFKQLLNPRDPRFQWHLLRGEPSVNVFRELLQEGRITAEF